MFKKYLEVNGQIIGFNVDPDFNYCLDGLLILDIYNIPSDFVRVLSKDKVYENTGISSISRT